MLPNEWKKYYLKELVAFACNSIVCYCDVPVSTNNISSKFGYVYIIIFRCKGYVYIGQHKSSSYKSSYISSVIMLANTLKAKYNRGDFFNQPIEFADTQEELDQLEVDYIAMAKDVFGEKCLNITKRQAVLLQEREEESES